MRGIAASLGCDAADHLSRAKCTLRRRRPVLATRNSRMGEGPVAGGSWRPFSRATDMGRRTEPPAPAGALYEKVVRGPTAFGGETSGAWGVRDCHGMSGQNRYWGNSGGPRTWGRFISRIKYGSFKKWLGHPGGMVAGDADEAAPIWIREMNTRRRAYKDFAGCTGRRGRFFRRSWGRICRWGPNIPLAGVGNTLGLGPGIADLN